MSVDPRDEAIATEVAYRMQSDWTGANMKRAVLTASMLARQQLIPAESVALTIALAQIRRGEKPTPNVAAMCVLALARIDGRYDYTADETPTFGKNRGRVMGEHPPGTEEERWRRWCK